MDMGFTSEQEILRKSIAEFLSKECPYERVKELEESAEGYSPELWLKIAELGWLEMILPEEYGGFGDPFTNMVIVLEEIGRAAFPSPFFSTIIQCGLIILEGGTDEQKRTLLGQIAKGKLIMAQARYEEDASYLKSGINMRAEASGNGYILNGTKMFVNDANIAQKLIVAARTKDTGITLFLVDAKDPGITISKMPTIAMDNSCEVLFKDVTVSGENIIGNPGKGWEILEKISAKAMVAKAAEMIGGCKASINMTADYAKKRIQYGKPIGGFQIIQHYMANMLLGYDTSFNYLYKVAWMIDEDMKCAKEASALKAQVNEQYKFITERSVQIHGGVGTTREFNPGLFYRRAKAFEFAEGDTD
jgi:alkylation response protein AidB-like acyl-CoA dehydrogenase